MTKQIGVIGPMADLKISPFLKEEAKRIGKEIARNNAILFFGVENDFESIPIIAARSCERSGGKTVAFVEQNRGNLNGLNSLKIVTGQSRGGGREFSLILSCDSIISLGGGSGTLMEMAMAYQANIPIITMRRTGGWSQRLAGQFLDKRRYQRVLVATSTKEAVQLAINK